MSHRSSSFGTERKRKLRRVAAEETPPGAKVLQRPTPEQAEILEAIWRGRSVRVIANAGTGKTKTLLEAAAGLKQSCLFLAYNRDIREEVQKLASQHHLDHLDVENYDSFLVSYYDRRAASQDFQLSLQLVLENDAPPLSRMAWGVVFLDEAQDLDENYAAFVQKILSDHRPSEEGRAQIVSVGDPKQNIFRYRGADARFFLGAGLHDEGDVTLRLTTTFRFCDPICRFVDGLCGPFFPAEYLQHSSGCGGEAAPVERWILAPRASGKRNGRLIQRLQFLRMELESSPAVGAEERLLVFLSGSRRESNEGLWAFVEELGTHEDPSQHSSFSDFKLVVESATDEPVGGTALSIVRNVHACKGQTFEAVVLFFTNRRSWVDGASGRVEREALYTALTRGRRLILVEEAETLIFQDLVEKAAACAGDGEPGLQESEALPLPRCASTGEVLQQRVLERGPGGSLRRAYLKPFLSEKVSKMKVEDKKLLLELISAPPLAEWAQREDEPSTKEQLRTLAAWLRLELVLKDERSVFNEFLRGLRATSVEEAYALLGRTGRKRALAPHLARLLAGLVGQPVWGAREYLELARFHANFHYGYLSLPHLDPEDETLAQELYEGLQRDYAALEAPQRIYEVRVAATPYNGGGAPVVEHGLYLCRDGVTLLKAEEDSSESLNDRLLVAYVACKLSEERYHIRRVLRAGEQAPGGTFVAAGTVGPQDRARYISIFEACLQG